MVIVETTVFTKQLRALLSDEEYRQLQSTLLQRPALGKLIVGSGGLRKVRWKVSGQGKSGGVRIIYYWAVVPEKLLMLLIYTKSEQEDLTPEQLKVLKRIIEKEYP
jgi:mRNA-degrading endonuclease RelE of RelBE toxin-antitoxin system